MDACAVLDGEELEADKLGYGMLSEIEPLLFPPLLMGSLLAISLTIPNVE